MTLFVEYNIVVKANTETVADNGFFSVQDSNQQSTSYNSNSANSDLSNPAVKRIDLSALPTPYATPSSTRTYTLDLESLQLDFLQMLHIKSDSYFLYSLADTLVNLNSSDRQLARSFFLDTGPKPSSFVFTPDVPFPKFIRVINPLELNGGGDGNSVDDTPITISIYMITTTPDS